MSLLAVANVAQLRHPLVDERMAGFVDGIDPINRLVEASAGFVWRGRGVAGHAALLRRDEGELLVNMSVWETYLDFHTFTYRGAHGRYLNARARWFVDIPGFTTALWWNSRDDPSLSVEEALARLLMLRRVGPSVQAFTVLKQWDANGQPIRRRSQLRRSDRR